MHFTTVKRWLSGWPFPLFSLLVAVVGLTSCSPAISKQLRDEAAGLVPFEELLQKSDEYKGRVVILGGYILETVNEADGTLLVILQAPLDSQNSPKSSDLSKGRYLVQTKEFLDPVVYSKDRKITVGGRVVGAKKKKLGNINYKYLVVASLEIHLWPKKAEYTRPYYYPYYDPWYYPWYGYPYPYRRW
ncbi:MAG: Slp family lipoprotein [Deltaproteobacteria bacterium]|nr:MAG: Slp family lipoprotein [Deltaproteobacteria bacterium]